MAKIRPEREFEHSQANQVPQTITMTESFQQQQNKPTNQGPRPTLQLAPNAQEESKCRNYAGHRSVPEVLLKQGVSAELWWQTYTSVIENCVWQARIERYCKRPLAPLCYPLVKTNQANLAKAWYNLIPKLQAKYGPLGIHVTLARDTADAILGLNFEIWKPVAGNSVSLIGGKPEDRRSHALPLAVPLDSAESNMMPFAVPFEVALRSSRMRWSAVSSYCLTSEVV